ncbi:ectoine hydroxylase-related dioxygenase (phytanoyl-CoA dioxygenase family) [Mucilaginibacter yixingensis]|uniref:Ectoine hydroxylase-related dioxygenase (Phytanoyl-CoA dioxygenase family) n=1 Tax=Mucilaginibacter yixingensis TaxID=1295612 RepID=A0A2T5J4P8_9SPHI|nr:phytanoyl-CoA dioxygenase family protein [Mucilaginibacter yixingensis]PTQ92635.1 ectoine hydroxylase-related dioxygenase (phytanoyl-CoA dioxygenase family) [Mucilaginibacter yixingensis]
MKDLKLSTEQKAAYDRDGYLVVKSFLSAEEVGMLYNIATDDDVLKDKAFDFNDQTGKRTKLTLWFTPGDDAYGLLTRSEAMVNAVQDLLGEGQVCHFHSKLMQKEPKVGGAWEWHQDYGYWYKNGFLFPDALISVMLALTEATKQNGCLQVLKGSHKIGRLEHSFAGEQQGADMDFVNVALERFELVHCELEPGDLLFFHPNTLHMSEANLSDKPRWSMISAYNLAYNVPFREKNTSCITPVQTVTNDAVAKSGAKGLSADRDFLSKENEITLNVK